MRPNLADERAEPTAITDLLDDVRPGQPTCPGPPAAQTSRHPAEWSCAVFETSAESDLRDSTIAISRTQRVRQPDAM
jgi:hypothetical protein